MYTYNSNKSNFKRLQVKNVCIVPAIKIYMVKISVKMLIFLNIINHDIHIIFVFRYASSGIKIICSQANALTYKHTYYVKYICI